MVDGDGNGREWLPHVPRVVWVFGPVFLVTVLLVPDDAKPLVAGGLFCAFSLVVVAVAGLDGARQRDVLDPERQPRPRRLDYIREAAVAVAGVLGGCLVLGSAYLAGWSVAGTSGGVLAVVVLVVAAVLVAACLAVRAAIVTKE